jgi:hypothetical protein
MKTVFIEETLLQMLLLLLGRTKLTVQVTHVKKVINE